MRIRRVGADAFGPLCGEELELADGMTVITGPNESGKSAWHAAIYAALCGMRRARGAQQGPDRAFRSRHRPWTGERWKVGALVELDDGRTVELHHDLDGLVDCHATDAVLGGDLTGEILFEGTPDGSAWLGLNRRTFLSVACVRQAQILQVIEDATHLQADLQRAAATAGADQTAARALEVIDEVQRERVGLERANSTRPLRRAGQRLAEAQAEEARARALHQRWQADLERLADLRAGAGEAAGRLRVAVAARAATDLAAAERRLERIRELTARKPVEPPELIAPGSSAATNRAPVARGRRPGLSLALLGTSVALLAAGIVLAVVGPRALGAAMAAAGTAGILLTAPMVRSRGSAHTTGHGALPAAIFGEPDVALLQARQERGELQALLAGQTPEQLDAEMANRRSHTAELAGAVGADQLSAWRWEGGPDQQIAGLRAESTDLERELSALQREVDVRTDGVCPVAEATEAVTVARQEVDRVETLRDDLTTTRRFLEAAKDRAHRNLAPQLAEAVRPWLGEVTSGRYTDVRVDPEALEVRVMAPDGRWRDATRLSQGTAEQVYLLLRIALADILTTPGTSCPLLLDDVLVQSDPQRSLALLELLLAESERRQVILFSQEDDVSTWARERLAGHDHTDMPGRHRHIELPSPASVGTRSSAPPQRPEDPDLTLDLVQPV
jgi:uncharacterized protein YhaN